MAGSSQQAQTEQEQTILNVLTQLNLQRDVPITGLQAGGLFISLCTAMTNSIGEQRASVEELASTLRPESAAAIAALASDADASLKRNKAASDESFKKLEDVIGDFDLRVANQKDTLELAVEATRTRVAKMEDEFQSLLITCRDSFGQIQANSNATIADTNRQLAQILASSGGGSHPL